MRHNTWCAIVYVNSKLNFSSLPDTKSSSVKWILNENFSFPFSFLCLESLKKRNNWVGTFLCSGTSVFLTLVFHFIFSTSFFLCHVPIQDESKGKKNKLFLQNSKRATGDAKTVEEVLFFITRKWKVNRKKSDGTRFFWNRLFLV